MEDLTQKDIEFIDAYFENSFQHLINLYAWKCGKHFFKDMQLHLRTSDNLHIWEFKNGNLNK